MQNPTLRSPAMAHFSAVQQFFADYPTTVIEEKLGSKLLMASPEEDTAATLHFYKNLMGLLRGLEHADHFETRLVPLFVEHSLVSMNGIIELIKHAMPVGMIYNLSKSEAPDLMIVLEKSCNTAYTAFESIIDLARLGFEGGTCTIHNYGLLNAQLSEGHIFYTQSCVEANLIYRKDTAEVFNMPSASTLALAYERAALLFNSGFQKAISFYEGAQYYFERHVLEMTMFMLHQASELTYRCLLNVLRGRDLKCHSPAVLRKHIKRFAPAVIGIFSEIEEEELYYLQLLEDAYIQARYQLDYSVEFETVAFLKDKVGLLMDKAAETGSFY